MGNLIKLFALLVIFVIVLFIIGNRQDSLALMALKIYIAMATGNFTTKLVENYLPNNTRNRLNSMI